MMEDKEEEDQQALVEKLAPTLHQEGAGDLSATVKTIILGRDFARADRILHTRRCGHGIFTADADAVDEERPDIADDPAVLRCAP